MFSLSHNVCCKNWVRTIYRLQRECLYKPINAPSRTGKIPSKLSTVSVWESRLGKWISVMREQNLDWDEESQGVEVTQHRTGRGGQTGHQREEHPGGPCYPRSGVDSTGQKLRSLLSQLHAGKSAAQISFRMMSGIPGPGVLTRVLPLYRVKRHPCLPAYDR